MTNWKWQFCIAAFVLCAMEGGAKAASPTIVLQKGTTLEQSIDEFVRARKGAVVVTPPVELKPLGTQFEGDAVALAGRISGEYSLHLVSRPQSWAFRRAYRSAREPMELELDEIRLSATAISRLIASLKLGENLNEDLNQRISFAQGITPEQRALMSTQGLPFKDLKPSQRIAFQRLNTSHAFLGLEPEGLDCGLAFQNWNRTDLTRRFLAQGDPVYTLQFLSKPVPGGRYGVPFSPTSDLNVNIPSFVIPNDTVLPGITHPRPLQMHITIAGRTSSLAELIADVSSKTAVKINIPEYARERQITYAAADAQAGDLLAAIQDLYGWDFIRVKVREYTFRFPQSTPVRGTGDLIRQLNALVPPPFAQVLAEGELMKTARQLVTIDRVLEHVASRYPKGWERTPVRELPEDFQDCAAQVFGLELLSGAIYEWKRRSEVPIWLTNPELGVLRWKGSSPTRGLLSFEVRRQVGRKRTSTGWGWVVGSSSREQQMQ